MIIICGPSNLRFGVKNKVKYLISQQINGGIDVKISKNNKCTPFENTGVDFNLFFYGYIILSLKILNDV